MIAGKAFAGIGGAVAGPNGAAPGAILVVVSGALDAAGTAIRVTGAAAITIVTGNYRPVIDAYAGFVAGKFAPEVTQPFVDLLIEAGLDKAFGEDMPMCR